MGMDMVYLLPSSDGQEAKSGQWNCGITKSMIKCKMVTDISRASCDVAKTFQCIALILSLCYQTLVFCLVVEGQT